MSYLYTVLITAAVVFGLTLMYHGYVLSRLRATWTTIHNDVRIGVLKAEQIPYEVIARMKW